MIFGSFTINKPKKYKPVFWTIRLIRDIQFVPQKYLKHLEGTSGLYELRVSSGNNIFRIFCFFDEGKLIILMKTSKNKLVDLEEFIDEKYGKRGSKKRDTFEEGYDHLNWG